MKDAGKVGVVGSGSWGTALANVFADAGCDTRIWGRDAEVLSAIRDRHENTKYLKGIRLADGLGVEPDLGKIISESEVVVCGIPTQQIRGVFQKYSRELDNKIIVNTSKGIEEKTHARVSEIFKAIAPKAKYVIVSGPSFALETAKRLPTAVTVASQDADCASEMQQRLSTKYFRGYTSRDVVGVELAGALKNVVAIAAGVVAGLNLGTNAQAAIINRGMAEITRFAVKEGAEPLTFLGLAGMGDLILTCTGPLSRNRRLGLLLGEGKKLEEIRATLGGVAEGYYTAKSALELAQSKGIELPITHEVYRVLYEGETAQAALGRLMSRDLKDEW